MYRARPAVAFCAAALSGCGVSADAPAQAPRAGVMLGGILATDGTPARAAVVTVVGTDRTATVGGNGSYALTLPEGETVVLRATLPGALPTQLHIRVPSDTTLDLDMELYPDATAAAVFAALGVAEDATAGLLEVHFSAAGTPTGGYRATLGAAAGPSFVVSAAAGPTPAAATAAGSEVLFFANVPAGTVAVTPVPPAGGACEPAFGLSAVRVDARTVTRLTFRCR